jgi:hypothetical protein
MACNFRVGQKVVAVKRPDLPVTSGKTKPIRHGAVLTIRAVQTAIRANGVEATGLVFEEIRNDVVRTGIGPWELDYDYRCFRPVVERGTEKGMSILRDLLNTQYVPVEAAS